MLPALLAGLFACTATWLIGDRMLTDEMSRLLDQKVNGAERRLAAHLSDERVEERQIELVKALRDFVALEDLLGVVVFDEDREIVGAVPIGVSRQRELTRWPDDPELPKHLSLGGVAAEARWVEFSEPVRLAAGAWITFDARPEIQVMVRFRLLSLIVGAVAVGLGWLFAGAVSRAVVQPLVDLTGIVTQLARGELGARYREQGPEEVQRLARQVNRIAERMEGSQLELTRTSSQIDGKVRGRTRYLEQTNRALIDLANRDPLTGLANRRGLEIELDRHVELAREAKQPFAVIMMDLDHFKQYNDTAGHLAGDKLLQTVASTLRARTRSTDLVVRWGGDEFCILLPYATAERAVTAAESLVEAVREATRSVELPNGLGPLGASAGVACFPEDADNGTDLIARADAALYQVKESGRGRVLHFG